MPRKGLFAGGLADLEAASAALGQQGFPQLSPEQQDALLTKMANDAQDKEKTFFHMIKELALLGYFTSEPIGRHVLQYDPVPGRFDGCIPLSEVGNVVWTR